MKPRTTLVIVALALALVAAGCGKKHQVGTGLNTNGKNGNDNSGAFVVTTTTTAAPTVTTAPTNTTAKPTATTAHPVTTQAPEKPGGTIKIQDDNKTDKFDPNQANCPVNHICRWTNFDTKPRSVVADDQSFASPMIAPGASWDYRPTTKGTHNYHDGTRPYAVGTVTFY